VIEIIALIFLCRLNGQLAEKKGLPKKTWWINTIGAWVACEFVGVVLGSMMFGIHNIFAVMGVGLFSAFGGYLLVRYILEKKPDDKNDLDKDINRIGVDDLRPPVKK
jgi:hypothetical protein